MPITPGISESGSQLAGTESFTVPKPPDGQGVLDGAAALAGQAEASSLADFAQLDATKFATPTPADLGGGKIDVSNAADFKVMAEGQSPTAAIKADFVGTADGGVGKLNADGTVDTSAIKADFAAGPGGVVTPLENGVLPPQRPEAGAKATSMPEQPDVAKGGDPSLVVDEAQGISYAPGMEPGVSPAVDAGTNPINPAAVEDPNRTSGSNHETDGRQAGQAEIKTATTDKGQEAVNAERQELQNMLDQGGPMDEAQLSRLQELKQTPEQQLQALRDIGIENWTDAQKKRYAELSQGTKAEQVPPEKRAEQINEQATAIGEKLLREGQISPEEFQRLTELKNELEGIKTSAYDKELAKGFAEAYLADPKELSKRFAKESATQREVREAIQKLMALELQLLNLPKILEQKREQRNKVKGEELKLREQLDRASPEERAKRTAEWGAKANQLAVLRNDIRLLKDGARIINAERRELKLLVDTKLGLDNNWHTVTRWVLNQGADAWDSVVLKAHELYDNE